MPQFARPAIDISDGGWTDNAGATDLATAIDESIASDSDYIQSASGVATDEAEIGLSAVEAPDPASLDPYVCRYRIFADTADFRYDVLVELVQGATVIASWQHEDVSTTPTTYEQTLSGAEADAITDYAGLSIRVTKNLRPRNNLVVGVGDSITVASHNTAGAGITKDYQFQPRLLNPSGNIGGYLTWAAILPKTGDTVGNGRFRFNGVHATGGQTAAQIKTTHIDGTDSPLNDNPKPGICVVLAGSNDIGTIAPGNVVNPTVVQTVADSVESIWDTLIAAGILPVAVSLPPSNGGSNNAVPALNAELSARASAKGIIFADVYTPCVGVAPSWAANYSPDGIHPSELGAKAMGQTLRDAIDPVLFADLPNLVTAATDGDADLIFENGAMERDSNADGIPNGGGQGAEVSTYWTFTANGAASSLTPRTAFDGQAWRVNKTVDTAGNSQMSGSGSGGFDIDLVDGHSYEIGFVGEIASWAGTTTEWLIQLNKITDGGKVPFRLILENDATFSGAIAPFKMLRTFRCSNSAVGTPIPAGGYRFLIVWGHRTGSPTDNLLDTYLGQLTIRDLGVI